MKIPIIKGTYEGRSSSVSPRRVLNMFYEKGEDEDALVSIPGDTVWNSTYSGEVRGAIEYNNLAWFVIGDPGSSRIRFLWHWKH